LDQPSQPAGNAGNPNSLGNAGTFETLRHRPFTTYLLINLISMIGKWMQRVAAGWYVWEITSSETVLGLIGAAELIPAIVLGPLAGVMADRVRPFNVVMICCLVGILQAVILGIAMLAGTTNLPLIFAMMLTSGIANGAMEPARAAMILTLVPKPSLANAVALDSLIYNIARFSGPALAGLLLLGLEPAILILINAAGTVPMVAILLWLARDKSRGSEFRPAAQSGNIWQEAIAGFVYVVREPRIAPVVYLLAGMSFFLRPLADMLPPFIARIPGGGPSELALLVSAFGIGSLACALAITFGRGQSRLQSWLLAGMAVTTLATLGFVYSEHLVLSFVLAAIAGGGQTIIGVGAKTIMQTMCETHFRGRVVSIYTMLFLGGPAIGLPIIGALAELVELRLAFIFGIMVNAAMVAVMYARKSLAR
jgi:MFS family permease